MKKYFLLFLLLLSQHSFADVLEDKTRKLFEAQGVLANYQDMIEQGRARTKEDAKKVMDQMLSQLNPSKEFQDRMNLAADKYMKALMTDRTAEQIVDVLVHFYAQKFTEQELDRLIAFYSSELGRKDALVSKESYQHLIQHYKDENDRIRISATNEFIKDLQLIATQCNCTRKPSVAKKK
jgi:hypothetical protein